MDWTQFRKKNGSCIRNRDNTFKIDNSRSQNCDSCSFGSRFFFAEFLSAATPDCGHIQLQVYGQNFFRRKGRPASCGMILAYNRTRKYREEEEKLKMEVCAFCGRTQNQVKKMVKAPNSDVCICDECSRTVFDLTDDGIEKKRKVKRKEGAVKSTRNTKKQADPAVTPSQIRTQLDSYVVGQEYAKKVLSVALYNHRKRLRDRSGLIKKSNILLVGPSGCGKTLLARTMARLLDVPFAMGDATSLTAAGYVGGDVESCLQRLLEAAGGDVKLAQKGVVFIDEIDKISCKESGIRDIGGRSVQAELLKMIEGSEVPVPVGGSRRNPNVECVVVDTTDILFICGGAFDGICNKEGEQPIGFRAGSTRSGPIREHPVNTEALVKYGLMPELVGRLPVICTLDGLTEEDFLRILTEPEDAITKEYELLLKKDGVKLVFEADALAEIAKLAMERKTGARGLRGILEDLMLDIMFDLPDGSGISKCIVNKETVKTKQPVLVKKRTRKQNTEGCSVTDSTPAAL